MKRFIIIDHSLQDLQGHHYECSVSVADAIKKYGFLPLIVAHKNFPPSLYPQGIEVISEFEVDWFNNSTRQVKGIKKSLKYIHNLLTNFSFENLTKDYREKIEYKIFTIKTTKAKLSLFLEKVEGSLLRFRQGWKQDIQLVKNIPFSHTVWRIFKIILGLIKFTFNIILTIVNRLLDKVIRVNHKSFKESLETIIKQLQLTPEDHIFIHTISIEQIEDLLLLLKSQNISQLPHYHLMLRRDIDDNLVKNAQGIGIKSCFDLFYQSQLYPEKVEFYTDTQELVNRYNSLSTVRLKLIPVPFRQEILTENIVKKSSNKPIHLVYLGDAREEKGYLHLPQIVQDLWADYLSTNKLKITIQSNFNINSGETGILASRLQLETYPEDKVTIIKNPLTPSAYYQLLNSADLLVIPYNNVSYRYRTSGVLTESLAAGKPVIVPENTWLANQIDDSRGVTYQHPQEISQAIIKVINNLKTYQENAEAFRVNWLKQNSPNNLIKTLLSPLPLVNKQQDLKIDNVENKLLLNQRHLLLVIDGDKLLTLENNQQLLLSYMEFLSSQNVQLSLIVYSLKNNSNSHNKNHWQDSVNDLVFCYNLTNIWCLFKNSYPSFLSSLDKDKYLLNLYQQNHTLTRYLIDINSLDVNNYLVEYFSNQNIDAIVLDSIASKVLVNKIFENKSLKRINIVCQVSELFSYQSAIINNIDVDLQELNQELSLFSQVNSILLSQSHYGEKLVNSHPHLQIYKLPPYNLLNGEEKLIKKTKVNPSIWGKYQSNYERILTQVLLKEKIQEINSEITDITISKKNEVKKRIAIFYPWDDILDRKAGASQRVGLLIDYLQLKGYDVWVFTTGKERDLLLDGIRYTFYEQFENNLSLVREIYSHIYSNFSTLNLCNHSLNSPVSISENIPQIMTDWRLSMYYQYRGDRTFEMKVKKVINWADIVFLEYPFWSNIITPICQEANVKLIVTTHDIICEQIAKNNPLYNILLAEEVANLKRCDRIVTVSEEDQKFLGKYDINSIVIPNPVAIKKKKKIIDESLREKYFNTYTWLDENYCLFVGSGHFPNIEAVNKIKIIAQEYQQGKYSPECKFIIIGSCCQPEKEDNFIALGKVDLDLLTIAYQEANLILVPMLHGTGSSLKIMEAMSFSKVILGTNLAFRGYPVENKVNGLIEDDLTSYPEIVADCLNENNRENMNKIGKNAFKLAQKYDYQYLYQNYEQLYS